MVALDAVRTGRWVGAAILFTFVVGMLSNFKLQTDLFAGEGLLVNGAAYPLRIGWVAVLGLATSLVSVATAATMYVFAGRAQPLPAMIYCMLAAATLATGVIESATLLAFRTVSEQFAAAGAPPDVAYQVAKKTLSGLRNGVHFLHVMLGGIGLLAFFVLLYRARLVPVALALAGIVAAPVQMFAVGGPLFGAGVIYALLAPLGLVYLALAVWLLVKGFAGERPGAAS